MDLITRFCQGVASRARIARYRASGVQIRGRILLRAVDIPRPSTAITLEDGVALDRGVVLLTTNPGAKLTIGERCYVNRHTMFDASEEIVVGSETLIGPFCYITDHDHGVRAGVAPSEGPLIGSPTRIGSRCWIGAHVTILKGVTVGDGSVIGAGSVVTKSIASGMIAVGNPARVLKQVDA